jgi:hypothetical protein
MIFHAHFLGASAGWDHGSTPTRGNSWTFLNKEKFI